MLFDLWPLSKTNKTLAIGSADWTHVVSNHDGFSRNQPLRYQSGNDDRLLFIFARGSDRAPLFIKPFTALLLQRDCNSISENCITHGVTLPVNSIQFDAQTFRREKSTLRRFIYHLCLLSITNCTFAKLYFQHQFHSNIIILS